MISLNNAIQIHQVLIQKFGGSSGIRDLNALKAALERPNMTFDGLDLYPTHIEKAAAIFESVVKNHPFIDGNKRTAYVLGKLLLMQAGLEIDASEDEKYRFVISVSKGEIGIDDIIKWLKKHVRSIK